MKNWLLPILTALLPVVSAAADTAPNSGTALITGSDGGIGFALVQEFEGRGIPEILTSGDHAKVAAWRRAEAEALTRARRPDLWAARPSPKATKSTTDG